MATRKILGLIPVRINGSVLLNAYGQVLVFKSTQHIEESGLIRGIDYHEVRQLYPADGPKRKKNEKKD